MSMNVNVNVRRSRSPVTVIDVQATCRPVMQRLQQLHVGASQMPTACWASGRWTWTAHSAAGGAYDYFYSYTVL